MTNAVAIAQGGSNNVTQRNRIINGNMVIDQRNAGASVTVNTGAAFFAADRFRFSGVSSSGVFTIQQVSDAPAGFIKSTKATVTTTDATLAGSDLYYALQNIEGFNIADLAWGSANAAAVTLSFWIKSSVTGTFGGALSNSAVDRSYPFTYTINAASTWEYKTVTIAGDTAGTWLTDNGTGIRVYFGLGIASGFAGTAGAWAASQLLSATGSVNLMATSAATWQITGVQLEAGTTASPFEYRQYGTELYLCQRYYAKLGANASGSSGYQAYGAGHMNSANTQSEFHLPFPQFMRATPTIAFSGSIGISANGSYINVTNIASVYTGVSSSLVQITSAAIGSAGQGAVLLSNADNTAYISLTAEL